MNTARGKLLKLWPHHLFSYLMKMLHLHHSVVMRPEVEYKVQARGHLVSPLSHSQRQVESAVLS